MADFRQTKLLIIGSGPAGYTAAVYGARAMLKPVLVEGLQPGGQLTITTDVENWPGEVAIMGPELMAKLRTQAEHVGTELVSDIVADIDLSKRPFRATLDSGGIIEADTVVIATGASARWLGLDSETRLRGRGVSACATCDGFFFRGKQVADVGEAEAHRAATQDPGEAGAIATRIETSGAAPERMDQALILVEAERPRGDGEFAGEIGDGEQNTESDCDVFDDFHCGDIN